MDGKRARFRRSDANLSITPKGFRDPSAFPSRGSMRSSSFEKRILSYANPYTGIIRQTECRREWPLEKTLETRLYPIHPFPARPCTHTHTHTYTHKHTRRASSYDRFARNYKIRLLARGKTLPRDSKRFQEDFCFKTFRQSGEIIDSEKTRRKLDPSCWSRHFDNIGCFFFWRDDLCS